MKKSELEKIKQELIDEFDSYWNIKDTSYIIQLELIRDYFIKAMQKIINNAN
jgi:AAA+ ATPase superfamily predicted ATPase